MNAQEASMARKGRELEIIIANIEAELNRLSGNKVIVTSPDFLIDKETKGKREVDASIKYIIGSVPIVITVECRDRATSNEDVTWIEQLIRKKEDLGVSNTIAVSSKGFSSTACQKAKNNGIETRTFQEISENQLDWLSDIDIPREVLQWKFEKLELTLESSEKDIIIDDKINNDIVCYNGENILSEDRITGEKLILNEIGARFVQEGQFPKIPGIIGIGAVTCSPESKFYMPTNKGAIRLLGLNMNVRIVKNITLEEPLIKIFEYKSENSLIMKMAKLNYGDFEISVLKSHSQTSSN